MRRQRGVSIVEVVVVIAVTAILISLAAPSFNRALQRSKVRKNADLMVQALRFAQATALRRNATVYVSVGDLAGGKAVCISSTTPGTCDLRNEQLSDGISVEVTAPNNATPSVDVAVTEVSMSGIYGSPQPPLTKFAVRSTNYTQRFEMNLLGLITMGALS